MIETVLAKEVFDSWRITPSDAYVGSFGIDLEKLKVYLKAFKAKDRDEILKISVDTVSRKMTVSGPNGIRVMSLVDDCGISDPKVPMLNLPTELVVKDAKAFRQGLKAADAISDHIALRYNSSDRMLYMDCEGDMDKVQSMVQVDVVRSESHTVQQTVDERVHYVDSFDSRSLFPLEYLINMAKSLPDGFRLELGNDYPLKLRYGRTNILLAPRIESGD
jgi:hypothetical protein